MLKIKDDVELKELEKRGFSYNDNTGVFTHTEKRNALFTYIEVKSWNRRISLKIDNPKDSDCLGVLYDLIKADLVEKVEEKIKWKRN